MSNLSIDDKKLKDRIHELEVHLATESEENRINLIKYENILGDYEVLLKRHEYLNSYSAEVANILNS